MAIFHKYPYTDIHDLNLDWILKTVKEMKEKFDSIDFDYIFSTLTTLNELTATHTTQIAGLQDAINSIGSDIASLNEAIASQGASITEINTRINTIGDQITSIISSISNQSEDIRDLQDDVADIQSDLAGIPSEISGLDGRVTTLESATFGDISVSPSNWNIEMDMRDLDFFNYEIVNTEATPTDDQTVTIRTATPRQIAFYRSGDICYLKLKNFLVRPRYNNLNNALLNLVGSFAIEVQTSGQKILYKKEGVTLSTLIGGLTCTPANDGYARLELVETSDGDYYDLHIYPVYNGSSYPYSWVNVNMFIFSPVSTFGATQYDVCKFLSPNTRQIYDLIKKNGADTSTIEAQITALQGDISTINAKDLSQDESITTLNNGVGLLASRVSDAESDISSIESSIATETRLLIDDILTNLPSGLQVKYFSCARIGKITYLNMMLHGFNYSSDFGLVKLGNIRSSIKSWFDPLGSHQIFIDGVAPQFSTDSPYAGFGSYAPSINSIANSYRATMIITGESGEPLNYYRPFESDKFEPNTIYVKVDDYAGTRANGFMVQCSFVTN